MIYWQFLKEFTKSSAIKMLESTIWNYVPSLPACYNEAYDKNVNARDHRLQLIFKFI